MTLIKHQQFTKSNKIFTRNFLLIQRVDYKKTKH
ncbi:unnamed protein product [Paramecium sonneborni]|uniref:Uncharacterized protein n=1 Tax=Paramecium sonneborni TaxID=65129 RepID=A0A8S1RQ87_9CILI|nr:unnamed protein product [Paramecium sonneborni]